MLINSVTANLKPYPMEALNVIKRKLNQKGTTIYDFGTGDPTIPVDDQIRDALIQAIPRITSYPSVRGIDELAAAEKIYLKNRFNINADSMTLVPTFGSKEAIFHIALSLVGRNNGAKKRIVYPDPGYPVYRSSALFAGGIPTPITLREDEDYKLLPWNMPLAWQNETAALWVNYPHNPTGATVDMDYYRQIIAWAEKFDVVILSDDCYVDIYDVNLDEKLHQGIDNRPTTPLQLQSERIIAFFSLSKRSGMTGFRLGFMAGDSRILDPHLQARANFGVAPPTFLQKAGVVAWKDDKHVQKRRQIFSDRVAIASKMFMDFGLITQAPKATFYLWAKIPKKYGQDDIKFCLDLAELGVIASPSSWLGEAIHGYFRLALVPEIDDMTKGIELIKTLL